MNHRGDRTSGPVHGLDHWQHLGQHEAEIMSQGRRGHGPDDNHLFGLVHQVQAAVIVFHLDAFAQLDQIVDFVFEDPLKCGRRVQAEGLFGVAATQAVVDLHPQ